MQQRKYFTIGFTLLVLDLVNLTPPIPVLITHVLEVTKDGLKPNSNLFFQIIAFDELKTDYKNPIDQCNSLNPLVLPEYILHIFFNVLFMIAGEWFSLCLNLALIAYHVHR